MMSKRRSTIIVNGSDLLCKNNCGFYGNPSWHYYCSVCYRNVYLTNTKNVKASNQVDLSQISVISFNKFEEKRKIVAAKGSNAMKKIFKINKDSEFELSNPDAVESKLHFESFIGKLKRNISNDIVKQVKAHLDTVEEAKYDKIEQYSDIMQTFYEHLSNRIKTEGLYKEISEEKGEEIMDEVEKYLCTQIYDWAFKPNSSDDETIDLELQKRIRSLYWVTPDILDMNVNEDNPDEKVHLDEAITATIEMNTKLCPKDKLECIVRCCKSVFEAIGAHNRQITTTACESASRAINADDFLPVLILVLIRANPTMLHSNIQFIMRFIRPSLINSGENGYMFTNMSIAIEFINTLDHKSLNMTEQEFADSMKGIKPVKSAIDNPDHDIIVDILPSLDIFNKNQTLLKELSDKEENLRVNLIELSDETHNYESLLMDKLESVRREVPLELTVNYTGNLDHDLDLYRRESRSEGWDKMDSGTQSSLPAPLLPTVCGRANWELFLQ